MNMIGQLTALATAAIVFGLWLLGDRSQVPAEKEKPVPQVNPYETPHYDDAPPTDWSVMPVIAASLIVAALFASLAALALNWPPSY